MEHAARIRQLENDIQKCLSRIDDLNRIIDQKTYDLKQRQGGLYEAEDELKRLNEQEAKYAMELERLKSLEERYRNENMDLQKRIDDESSRNHEFGANIKDVEMKIRVKED